MSRAFVKETAESAAPPERMVEEGPNPVTAEGMRQIDDHIARLEAAMQSETNVLLRETMARDLRYWTIRKSTAEIVQPASDGSVAFGSTVTITRKGRTQGFRIVGVDEADASKGLISFRAPLAAAVLGARVGDIIEAGEPLGEIEVTQLANPRVLFLNVLNGSASPPREDLVKPYRKLPLSKDCYPTFRVTLSQIETGESDWKVGERSNPKNLESLFCVPFL
jgi:transcription elongation GreA/GreB family factor